MKSSAAVGVPCAASEKTSAGVRGGLAPDDRRRRKRHAFAGKRHALAVALHFQLLQIRRQPRQTLVVGKDGQRGQPQESAVPHSEQTHQHRQVGLERRFREMFVDLAGAAQEFLKRVAADGEFGHEADGGPHRVPSAHPVPHGEPVLLSDAEGIHGGRVGRYRDEVIGRDFSPKAPTIHARAALALA